jgi:hypothetical protein
LLDILSIPAFIFFKPPLLSAAFSRFICYWCLKLYCMLKSVNWGHPWDKPKCPYFRGVLSSGCNLHLLWEQQYGTISQVVQMIQWSVVKMRVGVCVSCQTWDWVIPPCLLNNRIVKVKMFWTVRHTCPFDMGLCITIILHYTTFI